MQMHACIRPRRVKPRAVTSASAFMFRSFSSTLLNCTVQPLRYNPAKVAAAAFSLSAARLRCSRRRNDAERFSPPDVAPSAGAASDASISGGGSGGGGTTAAAAPLVLSALRAEDGPNEALRGRWLREGVPTCFQAAISLFGCRDCGVLIRCAAKPLAVPGAVVGAFDSADEAATSGAPRPERPPTTAATVFCASARGQSRFQWP